MPTSRLTWLPGARLLQGAVALLLVVSALLLAGAPVRPVGLVSAVLVALALAAALVDGLLSERAWRAAPLSLQRRLPQALAQGAPHEAVLVLGNPGSTHWRLQVHEHGDPAWDHAGWPRAVDLPAGASADLRWTITPRQRGMARFAPAELRLRSLGGLLELRKRVGTEQALAIYPNFSAVARQAWLAGDRRLHEIGIKTAPRRGEGTDFKQLAEYQAGDEVRRVDWKATLRHGRPIVREYQDERDQSVLFVLDCGRRMRADEGEADAAGSHFDQALNALMLLAYVALKAGDEVGALTFGTPAGQVRRFAPRKGLATLDALAARLHDVQPGTEQPDFLAAAREVMQVQRKRSLIVLLTNFRSEDAAELAPALKLLRTRHLVLLASLRETALRQLQEQPLVDAEQVVAIAGAHWFEQERRDAFRRLAGQDELLVDVEPARMAAELVSRYLTLKRSHRL